MKSVDWNNYVLSVSQITCYKQKKMKKKEEEEDEYKDDDKSLLISSLPLCC